MTEHKESESKKIIDPGKVPCFTIPDGSRIPAVGLGTFGSDHITSKEVAAGVRRAIDSGYRHLDCASVYGNEKEIGDALRMVFGETGLRREDFWITSKLWNNMHGDGDVLVSCAKSLKDLGIEYLDLYLVHWPFPNYHPSGCDAESRSPDARPYLHKNYMRTWRQMEKLVDAGLVRFIGTSNMTISKLELLLADARIRPVCNEMELHPHFQQPELFNYVRSQGMLPIGYSPIGSPARPERDRTAGDTVDIEDPVLVKIAEAHGIHPAVVCIKWAYQRGQLPIPFSTNPRNQLANLTAVCDDPLSSQEMDAIAKIDRGCRLIKGQVFLWEGSKGWEDLWDLDGEIAR